MEALDPEVVDNALARLSGWRHAGEFLVRHIDAPAGGTDALQQRIHAVEGAPERCTFTETETGMMIYLGDIAGEGIAAEDFNTAERIDAVLAGASA